MTTVFDYEASHWTLKSGEQVTIRSIQPNDEWRMRAFHRRLSEQSVYNRYFGVFKLESRITHHRLMLVCHTDPSQELALVVERINERRRREIIGVGRLTRLNNPTVGEFAIVLNDAWQGQGLGRELLKRLLKEGREMGLKEMRADILGGNRAMHTLAKKVGFEVKRVPGSQEYQAVLAL